VLIGGAVVAAIVALPLLVVLLGPAIVALVQAAAAAVASAAAGLAATAAGTGASWGFATVTKAVAAGIVVRLVAGGMSEAEAAEAVQPLIGKRIVALADVTDKPDMASAKPGQEISVEGQAFRAIIRLTTRGDTD
jgi:membrane protein implicated in regulation of membrane protease activity